MPELEEELRKFFAAHQPNESMKSLQAIKDFVKALSTNAESAGSDAFWDSLVSRLEGFDKTAGKTVKQLFAQIMKASGIKGEVSDKLNAQFNEVVIDAWPIAILMLIGIGVAVGPLVKPLVEPMIHRWRWLINAVARQGEPDVNSLINYKWRGGEDSILKKWWGRLGISDEVQIIQQTAAEPIMSIRDIQAMYQRWDWSKDDTLKQLYKLGYPKEGPRVKGKSVTELIYQTLRPLLPVGDIIEFMRRGTMDARESIVQLARHGHDKHFQGLYEDLTKRLLDINQLGEAIRRGYLTNEQWAKRLSKLGFPKDDHALIAKLDMKIPDYYLARNFWWRGEIDDAEYSTALMDLGYTPEDTKRIFNISSLMPTPTDLVRFGVREVFTPEIRIRFGQDLDFPEAIIPWGKKIGLNEEVLRLHWASHWDLPAVGQAFDMFHRKIINKPDLVKLLRAKDIMPFWQERVIKLSYRLIPRRALARMVRSGTIKKADVLIRFGELGYKPKDAELMASDVIKEAKEPERKLTTAQIIDDFVYAASGYGKLIERLEVLGYADDELAVIAAKALRKHEAYVDSVLAEEEKIEAPKAKELTKNEILRMFKEDIIGSGRATDLLAKLSLSQDTIFYLISRIVMERDREKRDNYTKQIRRLFDRRLITESIAATKLMTYGFSATAASGLIEYWLMVRTTDETIKQASKRLPTKADLNDWYKKGVIDVNNWMSRMLDLNYSRNDTAAYLLELIQDIGA